MKKLLIALVCLSFLFLSQGPLAPGTVTDGGGDVAFTSPDNAKVEDGVLATTESAIDGISCALTATNFGFSIPLGATVTGYQAEWKAKQHGSGPAGVNFVQVMQPIGGEPNPGSTTASLTGTLAFYSAGGSTDTWQDPALTPTQVNASTCGVDIQFGASGTETFVDVDFIRLTVFYMLSPTKKNQVIGVNGQRFEIHYLTEEWSQSRGGSSENKMIGQTLQIVPLGDLNDLRRVSREAADETTRELYQFIPLN
jgi:hypothetical protein